MNERIKNLLPNDRYVIQMHSTCREDYCLALTHLYQPLIGIEAVTIYFTMLNDVQILDGPTTHHTIMNMTNMDLDQFYQARLKLEAIGLLNTYVEEGDARTYYYIIHPPFSAEQFFEDSMLTILLQHQVGKTHFDRLQQRLLPQSYYPSDAIEKTKSFDEVFSTIHPNFSSNPPVLQKARKVEKEFTHDVDFEWLQQSLEKNKIDPERILTKENKSFIINLSKIYHIDNLSLEKAILWAIDENFELLHVELHEACKDFYVKNFNRKAPKLVTKQTVDVMNETNTNNSPKTKEDKLIEHFEKITHREILEDYSQSGYASENEVKMLTNIMFQHGLSQSVMNVLVHYVLQKSDMKLTRNYVEKIASHWARKKVVNARQAMEFAKSESKLYQSWGTKKTPYKKKEVLPDWFKNQKENDTKAVNTKQESTRDILKEKQELEKALRSVSAKL